MLLLCHGRLAGATLFFTDSASGDPSGALLLGLTQPLATPDSSPLNLNCSSLPAGQWLIGIPGGASIAAGPWNFSLASTASALGGLWSVSVYDYNGATYPGTLLFTTAQAAPAGSVNVGWSSPQAGYSPTGGLLLVQVSGTDTACTGGLNLTLGWGSSGWVSSIQPPAMTTPTPTPMGTPGCSVDGVYSPDDSTAFFDGDVYFMPLTLGAAVTVTGITLQMAAADGGTFQAALYQDDGTGNPGALIGASDAVPVPGDGPFTMAIGGPGGISVPAGPTWLAFTDNGGTNGAPSAYTLASLDEAACDSQYFAWSGAFPAALNGASGSLGASTDEGSYPAVALDLNGCALAPTLTPSPSATLTATPSLSPSATASPAPTATSSATPSVTGTASPTATATASATATPSATSTSTVSPSLSPTASPSVTGTATPTATPSASPSVTPTASPSATWSATPTVTPTATATPSFTASPTLTPDLGCTIWKDEVSTTTSGLTNFNWSHTNTLAGGGILVAGFISTSNSDNITSVSYGAQSLSRLRRDVGDGYNDYEIWYLVNPLPGTRSITVVRASTNALSAEAVTYGGVDTTTPFGAQAFSFNPGTTSLSVALGTQKDYSWTFGAMAAGLSAVTVNLGGSQTLLQEYSSPVFTVFNDAPEGPAGSYSMAYTLGAASNAAAVGVELRPGPCAVWTSTVTVTPSDTPTATKTFTASPSATPTFSPSPSFSSSPTQTPTATGTLSFTPSPTARSLSEY